MAEVIAHFEAQGNGRSVVLCSVCMPDAPTELHAPACDPGVCPGGGTSNYTRPPKLSHRYGLCTCCGTPAPLTQYGVLRKHKRPEPATA